MLPNQLISLLSFNAFTSGSRQDDISVNPANITMITQSNRSLTAMDGGEYRATLIHLIGRPDPVKVAQSREFIHYLTKAGQEPSQKYVRDRSQSVAAK